MIIFSIISQSTPVLRSDSSLKKARSVFLVLVIFKLLGSIPLFSENWKTQGNIGATTRVQFLTTISDILSVKRFLRIKLWMSHSLNESFIDREPKFVTAFEVEFENEGVSGVSF